MQPFTSETRPRILDEIDTAVASGRGRLLLIRAEPGSSSAQLLADAAARLAERRPAPELLAGGFDVAGARGDFLGPGAHFQDPDALLAVVRERVGAGRAVVLTLADVDLGVPTVNWADYFLLRALPPLLSAHRLVVVATVGSAGVDPAIVAELDARGLLGTLELAPEVPDERAGDDARAQLRSAFAPLGDDAGAKGYELAVRFLRIAALEGAEFTVAALARVVGEDEDALSDLFDDHLTERPDAPLEGLGFFEASGRSLYRYGFRSPRLWSIMHPLYGNDAWPSSPPVRRDARRYVDALSEVYGPDSKEAAYRIWALARLAGDDQGQPFAWVANGLAAVEDRARALAAEAAAHEGVHATRDPQAMLAGTRRILRHAEVAAPALERDDLLRYAKLARSLLAGAEHALGAEARPRAWWDVYELLGVAARRCLWAGDVARCEALRLALVDPAEPLGVAHQTTVVAEALLGLLAVEDRSPTHLDLAVPWLDELVSQGPAVLADRIDGLLNEASGTLAGVPAQARRHTEAHVLHARAGIVAHAGDVGRARDLDERALALLRDDADDHCGIRAAVLAGLTEG